MSNICGIIGLAKNPFFGASIVRAKCPHCGGSGCDQPNCVGGYLQVSFAEGDWWTCSCLNNVDCGFINGGRICEGFPPESSGLCVICGGPTEWVLMKEVSDEAGSGYIKNLEKHAVKKLEQTNDSLRSKIEELRTYARIWRIKDKQELTKDEAKLLGICLVCHESTNPTKEKGYFCLESWTHEKCEK